MAGAGFKTFATGEVLTAANVNTYLMQQTVMVFNDATARTTALGANVAEGMLSYLKDTDQVEVYNGTSWVASDDPNAIQNSIVDAKGDLITATADNVPARIGVGTNGQVLTADSTTATGLKWVTPAAGGGLNWTARNTGGNVSIYTMAYNGSNLYVVAGNAGNLYTSPDLVTWTSRTSGFGSQNIHKVIYANSLWVAVGSNGLISTSSDGTTWTARTANMSTNSIMDIHYANSTFVAVGSGGGATNTGGITYSTDGITWTRKSQTMSANGSTYVCVIYNGTNWLVGTTAGSTNNYLYATTPSGTWTSAVSSYGNISIYGLYYDGTKTYSWYDSEAGFYVTTDTILTNENAYSVTLTGASSGNQAGNNAQKNQIAITTSAIYLLGYYYQSVSTAYVGTSITVPQTTNPLTLAPTTSGAGSSPFITLPSNRGLLVTSLGVIAWSSNGRFWSTY